MNAKNAVLAVIDTNVLVSSLMSKKESNPSRIIEAVLKNEITPIFNDEIIEEYREVLSRDKFSFSPELIDRLLSGFITGGISTARKHGISDLDSFPDEDDIVFYEVAMNVEDSYLVTGNIKHFPISS